MNFKRTTPVYMPQMVGVREVLSRKKNRLQLASVDSNNTSQIDGLLSQKSTQAQLISRIIRSPRSLIISPKIESNSKKGVVRRKPLKPINEDIAHIQKKPELEFIKTPSTFQHEGNRIKLFNHPQPSSDDKTHIHGSSIESGRQVYSIGPQESNEMMKAIVPIEFRPHFSPHRKENVEEQFNLKQPNSMSNQKGRSFRKSSENERITTIYSQSDDLPTGALNRANREPQKFQDYAPQSTNTVRRQNGGLPQKDSGTLSFEYGAPANGIAGGNTKRSGRDSQIVTMKNSEKSLQYPTVTQSPNKLQEDTIGGGKDSNPTHSTCKSLPRIGEPLVQVETKMKTDETYDGSMGSLEDVLQKHEQFKIALRYNSQAKAGMEREKQKISRIQAASVANGIKITSGEKELYGKQSSGYVKWHQVNHNSSQFRPNNSIVSSRGGGDAAAKNGLQMSASLDLSYRVSTAAAGGFRPSMAQSQTLMFQNGVSNNHQHRFSIGKQPSMEYPPMGLTNAQTKLLMTSQRLSIEEAKKHLLKREYSTEQDQRMLSAAAEGTIGGDQINSLVSAGSVGQGGSAESGSLTRGARHISTTEWTNSRQVVANKGVLLLRSQGSAVLSSSVVKDRMPKRSQVRQSYDSGHRYDDRSPSFPAHNEYSIQDTIQSIDRNKKTNKPRKRSNKAAKQTLSMLLDLKTIKHTDSLFGDNQREDTNPDKPKQAYCSPAQDRGDIFQSSHSPISKQFISSKSEIKNTAPSKAATTLHPNSVPTTSLPTSNLASQLAMANTFNKQKPLRQKQSILAPLRHSDLNQSSNLKEQLRLYKSRQKKKRGSRDREVQFEDLRKSQQGLPSHGEEGEIIIVKKMKATASPPPPMGTGSTRSGLRASFQKTANTSKQLYYISPQTQHLSRIMAQDISEENRVSAVSNKFRSSIFHHPYEEDQNFYRVNNGYFKQKQRKQRQAARAQPPSQPNGSPSKPQTKQQAMAALYEEQSRRLEATGAGPIYRRKRE